MAWHITGTDLGPCSCDLGCPCILGAMEGDRGWCSAVRLYDIRSVDIDGVDVSGTRVALVADWPSGFLDGSGTGRLCFDPSVSQEQRDALESLIKASGAEFSRLSVPLCPTSFLVRKPRSTSRWVRRSPEPQWETLARL